jgi:hypothetical protein
MTAHGRSSTRRFPTLALLVLPILAGACGATPSVKAPAVGGSMPTTIVDPYLRLQEALASDSVDGVRANAGELATAATALGAPAMKIDTSAVQLASADDLADARVKFGALSEAIDAYMSGMKLGPPEGVRVAFCPMVLKPWMQRDGTLRNPYYGSQMITCGSYRN